MFKIGTSSDVDVLRYSEMLTNNTFLSPHYRPITMWLLISII